MLTDTTYNLSTFSSTLHLFFTTITTIELIILWILRSRLLH